MFKKLLVLIVLAFTVGFAYAQVEINTADQAALDGVKGLGPSKAKAILAERKKNGNFKDWGDFQQRVKGFGDKSTDKLSQAGLIVNGQAKPNAPPAPVKAKAAASASGTASAAASTAPQK